MNWSSHLTRRLATATALISAMLLAPASAVAEPGPEGGTPSLREQLDAAARGYLEAQGKLEASRGRYNEINALKLRAEVEFARLSTEVGTVADAAYRGTRLSMTSLLLESNAPTGVLHGAAMVQFMADEDDRDLRRLTQARRELTERQRALDAEVKLQEQQVAEMARRKAAAEKALGNAVVTPGFGGQKAPIAVAAVRNANGTWPSEGCSTKDPTTGGCLSPRTMHAYQQARAAGFTRHTSCYRSNNDGGEHPKGRACDFAAQVGNFGGAATGTDKVYGDNLATFFVANAGRLAVMYVIWYRQVWFPGLGWRAYTSGGGSPSGEHTNHVHVSIL